MALGCSIAGPVDPKEVLKLVEKCLEAGVDFVAIADTVGYAGPKRAQFKTQAGGEEYVQPIPSRRRKEKRGMKLKRPLIKALVVFLALLLVAPQGVIAQGEGGDKPFKQEELDQLVAPIALYPDSLLAQILMASTYPLEVVDAARWAKANQSLKGDALTAALEQQNWDPSVKSLVNFPQVLDMMNEKLDWTQKMGDAFLAQQKDVMDTVQKLRLKAYGEGNLKSTEQQKVVVEEEQKTIIIEPAKPEVVYVPTYNPTVVYGAWPYPAYPPYYYYPPYYPPTVVVPASPPTYVEQPASAQPSAAARRACSCPRRACPRATRRRRARRP